MLKTSLVLLALALAGLFLVGCTGPAPKESKAASAPAKSADPETAQPKASPSGELEKVVKTEDEWKAQLSEMEYYVVRKKGTERAFSGKYWKEKRKGTYRCIACDLELFSSETKFESGTGWPSFYEPAAKGHVASLEDRTHGMVRTEVLCARCDGHLGHVFRDGPRPTGLRYCINSASLSFQPEE